MLKYQWPMLLAVALFWIFAWVITDMGKKSLDYEQKQYDNKLKLEQLGRLSH